MPQDDLRELLDLSAIHNFYVPILEQRLGHPVPPHEVKSEDPATLAITLHRWLNLLDLAISPEMVRDALQKRPTREPLEALLRMYILKSSPLDSDRDKADFLATYLYRNPPRWRPNGRPQAGETAEHSFAADFEEELYLILGDVQAPDPPLEHKQLVRELDFIREQVEDIRHFDQLTDSRVVQRVRELKTSLRSSFYHPAVLSRMASYNAFFGRRFDELFRAATGHIKSFAQQVTSQGGSVMSRVEGDIMIKNLTEVEEEHILRQEYGRAQEQFREIATMKKVVDHKHAARAVPAATGAAASASAPAATGVRLGSSHPPATRSLADVEESKLRGALESIQHFVRAAEPGAASIVPLRNMNIGLSAAEIDAFRADFHGEKSFRADLAGALMRMVCIMARMQGETADYHARHQSAYLWKPHADALQFLLVAAEHAIQKADAVIAVADLRGLKDKIAAVHATQQKLRNQMLEVTHTLAQRVD